MSYDSFEDDAASQKGGEDERLTLERARRIVEDVLDRRDRMPRKKKTDEEEIDSLVDELDELDEEEDVEDVEDEEDEEDEDEDVEDEDEIEDEDEDPDEAPKRTRKSRSKKSTSKRAAKAAQDGVGTAEVAEAAGIEPRQLRMYLRAEGIQPDEGRYHWPSLENKEVKAILRDIHKGAVDKLNKEKIAGLKGKKKSTAKKSTAKKTTRTKVRSQKK
jgi:hypothetical protein